MFVAFSSLPLDGRARCLSLTTLHAARFSLPAEITSMRRTHNPCTYLALVAPCIHAFSILTPLGRTRIFQHDPRPPRQGRPLFQSVDPSSSSTLRLCRQTRARPLVLHPARKSLDARSTQNQPSTTLLVCRSLVDAISSPTRTVRHASRSSTIRSRLAPAHFLKLRTSDFYPPTRHE